MKACRSVILASWMASRARLARKVLDACEYHAAIMNDLILNVAFNYGGRDEIVHAVQNIVRDGIAAEAITEATISD